MSLVREKLRPNDNVESQRQQTDVGVIPADWGCCNIDAIADKVGSGITPRGGVSNYRQHGRPFVRSQNVGWGNLRLDDLVFIDESVHSTFPSTEIQLRDVLLNITGASIGRAAQVIAPLVGGNVNQHVCIIRTDRERYSSRFLKHILVSSIGQKQIDSFQAGGNREGLNFGQIKSMIVPLPPTLAEQEAIASALGDTDALIESLKQLLAKKRLIKQGAMQELLTGKRRLPQFQDDWVKKTLSELADIRSGGTPSTSNPGFWNGDVLWCTPTDITELRGFKYLSHTKRKLTDLGLQSSSAEVVPARSIVMTSRATIGECAINTVPVSTNQGFKSFVPFDGVDAEFLYYLLRMQTQDFVNLCGGSTFLEIGKSQLATYRVEFPKAKAEQVAIAETLAVMDEDIAATREKVAKAHRFKQAMMQQLLVGRIRLL